MAPIRVIGVLSGTSMDAIDVAVARLRLDGDLVELTPVGHTEVDYPEDLRSGLHAALPPGSCTAETLCRLDTGVGQAFAAAVDTARREIADGEADLVCSLGQTLYHWVDGDTCLGTLQLGQPAWIAETTGLPVVSDLRARDVAAGGHGAPLAGLLDTLLVAGWDRAADFPVAVLNIGGIANVTVTGGDLDTPLAFDTGPGNALLDLATSMITGKPFDEDGTLAAGGLPQRDLLEVLLADPYYARTPPKSTGREYFDRDHLRAALDRVGRTVSDADLLATLVELTAATIADACRPHGVRQVVASGGGVRNPALMTALTRRLAPASLTTSEELGIPGTAKEAYLAALLGFLTWCGVPANCPGTGAKGARLLGSITPGAGPLRPPDPPEAGRVTRLRVRTPAG
jgi:anhydro-N-acetylmuramic acid kinase